MPNLIYKTINMANRRINVRSSNGNINRRVRNVRFRNPANVVERRINRFINNPNQPQSVVNFTQGITMEIALQTLIRTLTPTLDGGDRFLLGAGDVFFTLSENSIAHLENRLQQEFISEYERVESDAEILLAITDLRGFVLKRITEDSVRRNRVGGAFFKYINKTDMNLEQYGIHKTIEKDNYKDCCLVIALREGGMSDMKLNKLRTMIYNELVPKSKLNKICETLKIKINLFSVKMNNTKDQIRRFPRDKTKRETITEEFDIGCYEDHYFINNKTNYTKYSVLNHFDINNIKGYNHIFGTYKTGNRKGNYQKSRNDKYKMKTFDLIKLLLELKDTHLEKITYNKEILETQFHDRFDKILDLEYEEKDNTNIIEYKPPKDEEKYKKVFFDFETYRKYNKDKTKKDINEPYLVCFVDENDNKGTFYGKDCGKKLLDAVEDKSLLIAHNATFDINFIIHYLYGIELIQKGKKIIRCKGLYKGKRVIIKDSWLLISMPLSKFGSCFHLDQAKEVMAYKIYDEYFNSNNRTNYYPIDKAIKELNDKEKSKLFMENLEKWELIKEDKFNLIQYSARYCMIDCIVLKNGYDKFREWLIDISDIDTDNVLTLAGLADKYFVKENCYEDINTLSGIPREFIQRCVVGGRTMCNQNKKYQLDDCKLADFDAVSLYPSAMDRLEKELGGFLKGCPKVLKDNQLNMNYLNTTDGYFIEINVLKVNKHREFPLMSKVENCKRNFRNDMEGENLFVDKITLEDLINFHKMEFKIIRGYYYNEGRNPIIGEKIRNIFNERLKMKKEKNPIQMIYKLLMNSGYGKTILKPIIEETKCFCPKKNKKTGLLESAEEQAMKFIKLNYNYIKDIKKINENCWIIHTHKSINEHYSRPHIGVEILSMSKRIMNEVMTLAEDKGYKIYYTDTDSMHIGFDDVPLIAKDFNDKYNRVLCGKNMGQFHVDFDLHGVPKENEHTIYARNSVFLGKKTYIDELVGLDKDNNEVYGYHIRAKGIPNSTILYECQKLNLTPLEMYRNLYKGIKYEFDLLQDGTKVMFEFNNFNVFNSNKFTRSMFFPQ